jgi:hypothetical protein
MDGEDDFDGGGDEGGDIAEAEDTTSRSDVEEAVIRQRQDRGDPDPRRADRGSLTAGPRLKGNPDYSGLENYHDEARKNGTSLQNAVRDYSDVEGKWRQNPVGGLVYTAQKLGLDPRQLVAAAYQQLYGQNGNQYTAQAAHRVEYDNHVRSIEQFKSDPGNKYFDHVRMDMARLVQAGRATTLQQAYRMAVNQHPQLRVMAKMEKQDAARDRDMKRARRFSSYGGY